MFKNLLLWLTLCVSIAAHASGPFTYGQVLTSSALNAALAAPNILGGTINNTPVGNTTPNTGAFTTLSATGSITPSQIVGIIGTTTNNNANAGSVGEVIGATVASGSAVALTSGVTANVTSVSLTAGDWMCNGGAAYHVGSTTSISNESEGISTTSATFGALGTYTSQSSAAQVPGTAPDEVNITGSIRELLASTTTVYLVTQATFTVSTNSTYGYISCTRTR